MIRVSAIRGLCGRSAPFGSCGLSPLKVQNHPAELTQTKPFFERFTMNPIGNVVFLCWNYCKRWRRYRIYSPIDVSPQISGPRPPIAPSDIKHPRCWQPSIEYRNLITKWTRTNTKSPVLFSAYAHSKAPFFKIILIFASWISDRSHRGIGFSWKKYLYLKRGKTFWSNQNIPGGIWRFNSTGFTSRDLQQGIDSIFRNVFLKIPPMVYKRIFCCASNKSLSGA